MLAPLILFAIAAVGGLTMAGFRMQGRNPPIPLALLHGALAALGLILLIVAVISSAAAGHAGIALVLFVIAALGGFVLFSFHARKKLLPLPLMVVHALVAVAGFVLLLITVLSQR